MRYLNSFFITFIIYLLLAIGVFYLFNQTKINSKKNTKIDKKISLKHIQLKPEIKKEPKVQEEKIVKKTQEVVKKIAKPKNPIKKLKKTKKIKTVKKKLVRPKVKKRLVRKKIKSKIQKKYIVKNSIQKTEPKKTISSISKEKILNKPIQIKKDLKKEFLKKYLNEIRVLINKNIKYPKRARKLHIEGIVKVRFFLLKSGKLGKISILNGNSLLKKATIKAIKKASLKFPKTPKDIDIIVPIEFKII